jgi:hypothetical protein
MPGLVYHARMTSEAEVVDKLFAVFGKTDASGRQLYPFEDLRHFLPWVLVNMPVDFAALDDDTVAIFAETCAKAKVGEGDDVMEKLSAYYEENPPNAALVSALQAAWREVNAGADDKKNPFAKFSGTAGKSTAVLDSGGKRPEGTIPAGPMARFQKLDPKK